MKPKLSVSAGVKPGELEEHLHKRSIIENADKIQCSTLIVTSKGDTAVPHALVAPLIDKLKELDKDVTTHVAEKAPHS